MIKRQLILPVIVVLAFASAACGTNNEGAKAGVEAPASSQPEVAAVNPGTNTVKAAYEITIEPVGNTLKFNKTEFSVSPGQTVHIIFKNTADNAAMSHNVVVVRSEDVINTVGQAGMMASDTDYVPMDMKNDIIAFTPMSAPGETVEVTFTAPTTPGDYPYICTFPGHYLSMTGIMRVTS